MSASKRAVEAREQKYPGETPKEFRQRLLTRCAELVENIKEGQAQVMDAFNKWEESNKQEADEGFIPQVEHEVLSTTEAQMLDNVLPGMDEYYFCRQRKCRNVFATSTGSTIPPRAESSTCVRCAGNTTGHGWRSQATPRPTRSG